MNDILRKKIAAALLSGALLLGAIFPGAASASTGLGQWIWWTGEGDAYKTFGGNTEIVIHTGKMQIIPHCPEGNPDGLNAWTDLFIVESGSLGILNDGDELKDVGGGDPNTVMSISSGIFISEPIGFTGPDGKIPPGEYAIVFDECQDGKYNALIDGVIDPAFKVEYTVGQVPPLDLTQLKEDAGKLAERWEKYREYADKLFKLQKAADAGRNPNEKFVDFLMRSGLQDPRTMALLQLANQAKHYKGIKDDPPDPDYKHLTPLGERPLIDFQDPAPLQIAMQTLANEAANEQAITRQMWTLLERYQGAQATGDVSWALTHGKALSDNIGLLLDQIQQTNTRINQFNQAFAKDSAALNEKAASLAELQQRVAASDFTEEELQAFASLGFTDSEIAQFKTDFLAMDFEFAKSAMLAEGSALIDTYNEFGPHLVAFSNHVVTLINQMLQDPTVPNDEPYADAGGPYSGREGSPITFSGASSTGKGGITAYEWDLDSDGAFDDAAGVSVTYTYTKPFIGLVGLKVTAANGKQAIHYAQIGVSDVNTVPAIVELSPPERQVEQHVGEAQVYGVTAVDLNNDPITIQWFVDGAAAEHEGPTFTYTPTTVGIHAIDALISDSNPLGGTVLASWTAKVVQQQPPASVSLAPESKTLSLGAVHTLQAKVLDKQGQPVAGTPVMLTVTGANPTSLTEKTDHNGVATFHYTGTNEGEDQIVAQVAGLTSNTAAAAWTTDDVTAPVTAATLSPSEPNGTGGYYRTPVTVTLTAEDAGSGIAETEYRVNGGGWQTYTAPFTYSEDGEYAISYRSTDHAGNVEADKQISFKIGASEKPQAFFNPVTAGKNVALLEEGASVAAVSSNYDSGHSAENMLKFSYHNPWATRSKDNQWVQIGLAGGESYLIDRIQIKPRTSYAEQRVKDFEIAVSDSTLDAKAFTTVITGTLANNGEQQEFLLPKPMKAKYILYRPLSAQGGGQIISTQQLKVKTGQIGGETVTFKDLSTDKNNDIVSWKWDFGDNSPISTEREPTHTFPGPGTYPVTLTVTDADGQSNSFTLEQTVEPVDFEVWPKNNKEGEYVTFINTTAGGDAGIVSKNTWDFGDKSNATGQPMTVGHTYSDNGSYNAKLTMVTKDGKTYQVTKPVTIENVAPTVNAGVDATILGGQRYQGNTVRMQDPGRNEQLMCHWDYDDGTTSTSVAPYCQFDHTYPELEKDAPDRIYNATLTVTDKDGGVGKDTVQITARAKQTPRQIAFYTFDGNFQDSSGNGNHGTETIGKPTFVEGIIGQAAKFDGRSGVLVPDSDSLDLSDSFSFSMWIYKIDGGGHYAPILSKGHTAEYGPYSFLHNSSGDSPGMRLVSGDRSGYTHLFPNTPMPDEEWYMATVTWDGTMAKYYINGEFKAQLPWKGVFENTDYKLTIGFDPPGATEYYKGLMDDFRMFNYPLTEQEIEQLYELKDPDPVDTVAPVTTAEASSAAGADPATNWHRADITLTLTATDGVSSAAPEEYVSGVKHIEYRVNGGDWTVYTSPIVIQQNGVYTYEYRSTDNAGNVETAKSIELKLDKSAPVTLYHFDPIFARNNAGQMYISGFTVTLRASDSEPGSGVAKTLYRINGGQWTAYTGQFQVHAGTTMTVEYYSVDQAGNTEGPMNKMDFVRGVFTGAGSF
ncbi:PKD domain-containing protein [Paenibacillus nanensis]|uniref:PKD domain-containing protein n=1 Tax=Paenibacillus nanensis TaxID=393251 RepID=A0A3A1VGR4_9BACL|nr:PKD domain-containing protein [Paenibacillus nanensis]RIX60089.1 PKD domain-containing protein [Paenibacillus nanensis]